MLWRDSWSAACRFAKRTSPTHATQPNAANWLWEARWRSLPTPRSLSFAAIHPTRQEPSPKKIPTFATASCNDGKCGPGMSWSARTQTARTLRPSRRPCGRFGAPGRESAAVGEGAVHLLPAYDGRVRHYELKVREEHRAKVSSSS